MIVRLYINVMNDYVNEVMLTLNNKLIVFLSLFLSFFLLNEPSNMHHIL